MALNYSIAMMGNPMNQEEAKRAYAKAQVSPRVITKSTRQESIIADHRQQGGRNCCYHRYRREYD